ncbi:hypothetical protein BOX15_Mlig018828g1 [Macrostomum lignano]|uniref:Uncharacterized protein n=1 Tax=Macrostomum lignano TaxID=282301 RepID=A0A267DQA7_9PLAT|nr:hypothetical protein BOX15_Mlig018828g3 [Macrostomum lignano]PAA50739.1 hypothetical protein BOX15_Mlig018828g2 [Macrostomum lignano]PAA62372.1 hypothetical protein BOX15_Mlig018828g1 [Macrostomum lignano]
MATFQPQSRFPLPREAAAAASVAAHDTIGRLSRSLARMNAEAKAKRRQDGPKKSKKTPERLKSAAKTLPSSGNRGCHPGRPGCQPVIIHLPDELFDDPSSGDEDDDDEEDEISSSSSSDGEEAENGEEDEDAAEERERRRLFRLLLPQPLKRNGRLTLKVDDPNLRNLLQSITDRFEPGQPDMLDRVIAMFNSGRCLGPEGEAQMRRLRVQQRRRLRRRLRRSVDPNWSPDRRLMSMAECFRSLGRILGGESVEGGEGGESGEAGRASVNGLPSLDSAEELTTSPPTSMQQLPQDTTDGDYPDEGLAIASPSPTMSPSPPESPSPPQQQPAGELRLEITEESLARLSSLTPAAEGHFRRVLMSALRVPATRYCLSEAEPPPERRWLRHCARQSLSRLQWDRRLAESVSEMLQRRLSAVLYDPEVCSRLTSLLASDLLELVTHELGAEFKVVGLLSIGSVTEIDRMAIVTRSAHSDGVDCCRAFHYQNESVFALFTCHLFQRFDRPTLSEAPLDIDDPAETAESQPDRADAPLSDTYGQFGDTG